MYALWNSFASLLVSPEGPLCSLMVLPPMCRQLSAPGSRDEIRETIQPESFAEASALRSPQSDLHYRLEIPH